MELNIGKALQDQKIFEQGIARITVILGIVIVMTAGIAGACLYYFWYDARTPELSANVMVPETQIYTSINLRPEKSELFKLQDIFERFKETKGFDEGYNDILDDFRNETGVDVEDDILPWLEELAIGITMDINNPEDIGIVVLGGTSDSEASTITVERILDYARDNNDFEFEEAEYRAYDYIFNDDDGIYLAVTEEYVILCNSTDLLIDVIDLIADDGESLADQPKFQNARDEMPSNRVGFFYMDTESMFSEAFNEAMSDYEYGMEDQEQINLLEETIPEYIVASAQCIDYGLKIDYYTKHSEQIDQNLLVVENDELKSMELIPADALGLISYSGISSLWEQQRSSMDEEMNQELDEMQNDIREEIGYDLDGIFALIDGEIAITMLPGGMYISPDGEFDGMPRIVALVEIEDREEMDIFVEDMKELVWEEYEMEISQIDISGNKAFIFSDSSGENEIAGYMYMDDFFVIGLTQDALAKIVETSNGISPSLAENNGMVRPFSMVKDANSVFYLNIQGIIDQVLELIPDEVVDAYEQEYARYFEPFETCLFTGSGDVNNSQLYSVGTFIITFSTSSAVETPTSVDSDNDGWTDDLERSMKTNPYSADTDKDGIIDPEDPDPFPTPKPNTSHEFNNIRLAVTALMADAGVGELDADYYDVDTHEEVESVTAGNGMYRLTDYLNVPDGESLAQSYDIEKNGFIIPSNIITPNIHIETEMKNVMLSITALMADHVISEVAPQMTWTNDLSKDIIPGTSSGAISDYLESDRTAYYYTWESDGTIHQCRKQDCEISWIIGEQISSSTIDHSPMVEIVIGNLTDITGPSASSTKIVDMALNDMIRYFNEEELIPGVGLDIISYDSQYDPARAIPGYEWLRQKGSDLIFTSVASTPSVLEPLVNQDNTALFSAVPRSVAPDLTGYVFHLGTDPADEAHTLLKWIAENDWDYIQDGPASIGGADWAVPYSETLLNEMQQYATTHPDQFKWEGSYLTNFSFTWGPEIEALKSCDYVVTPTIMTSFVNQYRDDGYTAKFIGTNAHSAHSKLVDDAALWDDIADMLFILPIKWWNDDGQIVDLSKELLYKYHPSQADEIMSSGSGYLTASSQAYAIMEIISDAVKQVGAINLDSETIFDTAKSFSLTIDGIEQYSYNATKRGAVNHYRVYEANSSMEDIYRADASWIPIFQNP